MPAQEKWFKSNHPYIQALLVYLGGYIFKHTLDDIPSQMFGRGPIKWGQRPDMAIAVDWTLNHKSNQKS